MAGTFTHWAGNTQYFKIPVEAWRGLLDNPQNVLGLCQSVMCADCADRRELSAVYNMSVGGSTDREKDKNFRQQKQAGVAFLETLGTIRVCFSISREMFWQYIEDMRKGAVKEWDWLLLLWWLSLHTIDGRRKGANAIKNTSNGDVFRRAAGFSTWAEYKAYNWQGDEAILKYIAKPARYAERLRTDLMAKYDTFHAYSEKGRRGWCFILAKIDRQQAIIKMAAHMGARGGTKQQFKRELAEMKARARAMRDGVEAAEVVEAENEGCTPQRGTGAGEWAQLLSGSG